jgi:hypothetical protein
MEIRGLQLGQPLAGPASAGPDAALLGALRAAAETGSVAEARVLTLRGTAAVLDLLGHEVEAEAHTQLRAGDRLFVRVEVQAGGVVRLAVQASGPADGQARPMPDAELDALLREQGLPADERGRAVARALVARDGRLDVPAAQRLLQALRPFATVGPREAAAAALLQRTGLPLAPATLAQVMARAEPGAPPALAARLAAALPGLQAAAGLSGPGGEAARALLSSLGGLPLAGPVPALEAALRTWVTRLTPPGAPGPGEGLPAEASEARTAAEGAGPVLASQRSSAGPGINYVNPATVRGPDLASLLEQAARALGPSHADVKQLLSEAVAEVRYLQLANAGPPPGGPTAPALVPFLLPRQTESQEEAVVRVHRRSPGPGEEPGATRLELAVPTEHLAEVQASLVEAGGRLTLTLGLADAEARAFVETRLEALRDALTARGITLARLEARVASPRPSQPSLEGAGEVLHFDRRV